MGGGSSQLVISGSPQARPGQERTLDLLAAVLDCTDLEHACLVVTQQMAHRLSASRVSVGFRDGSLQDDCQVSASSAGPLSDLHSRDIDAVAAAMDEALDQATAVYQPAINGRQPCIALAHASLLRFGAAAACSIPLVADRQLFGALCIEWPDQMPSADDIAAMEHQVCLIAPILYLHRLNQRTPWQRLRDVGLNLLSRARAPEGGRLRAGLVVVGLLLLLGLMAPIDDTVGGKARVEGAIQRVLVAPIDGFVKAVHTRPGDPVAEGQLLLELADEELGLDRQKWSSELAQHENAYAAAFARSDRSEMVINLARAEETRSRLALAESRLSRSRLTAPFSGVLIQGDLVRALGAPVKRGDVLMTVAPLANYRVIVEVDQRDIGRIAVGQTGALAVSALPWKRLPLTVARITPMATPVERGNIFEVEASLAATAATLQPGLEGTARIVVGRRALLPRLAERAAAWARLAIWPWWG